MLEGIWHFFCLIRRETGRWRRNRLFFSAAASHDGDFTSGKNPFTENYRDLYSILKETVRSFGEERKWICNYYTYLDCISDNALAWEAGGTADIASLFRTAGMKDQNNPLAWDYSVFEYSVRPADHYGTYLDNIERSLSGMAEAFGLKAKAPETETGAETEAEVKKTILSGDGRMIDLMGEWYFRTASSMAKEDALENADSIDTVLQADWEKWDIVQPGLDWWDEDFAACLEKNPWYSGYAWYVRQFEIPEGFDVTILQIQTGMIDEADEIYLNGVRVGQTGISSSKPRVRGLIIVGTVKKEAPTPQPGCRTSTPSVHLQGLEPWTP